LNVSINIINIQEPQKTAALLCSEGEILRMRVIQWQVHLIFSPHRGG